MEPIDLLQQEHRIIERVLAFLERAASTIEGGQDLPLKPLEQALDFIRTFADRCHHAKEERILFPLLEERGMPQGGPTWVMRAEHQEGRALVREMAEALEQYRTDQKEGQARLLSRARAYTSLMREHIAKEDTVLFPMARQFLAPEDALTLLQEFQRAEHEEVGPDVHERYQKIALELEKGLNG